MKVVLAVPTYGPTEPEANRTLRAAIMFAARHGVEWVGDASTNRVTFEAARNGSVRLVLDAAAECDAAQADAVLWVDSDVILPIDGIARLCAHGKDFVTGIYTQREPPHFPLIAMFDSLRESFSWLTEWPTNVIMPIDGCGFGCVLTSTAMLRAIGAPWFKFQKYSEDLDFCVRARTAGYQLFVDTGILCGHLREPKPATVDDFVAVRDSGGIEQYARRIAEAHAALKGKTSAA
jgi:hypothetical protein